MIETAYEHEEVSLHRDDVLVFYSDGVTEAWNAKQEEFEDFRLIRDVRQELEHSSDAILAAIEREVRRHVGRARQSDDFTCVVIKLR